MDENSLPKNVPHGIRHPHRVLADHDLSTAEKIKLLEDWRLDLLELQRAAEENMPSATVQPGEVAERLRQVTEALAILRESL